MVLLVQLNNFIHMNKKFTYCSLDGYLEEIGKLIL